MQIREHVPEMMDDPALDGDAHRHALRSLGRINLVSRSAAHLWGPIAEAARAAGGRRLRVLDLACGGGDLATELARRAAAVGLPIEVHGGDVSERAIRFASDRASELGGTAHFFRLDAIADPLPDGFDVLTSTLFLHHLTDAEATGLLARMAVAARHSVLVDDLIRSRAGYALAWAGCRLLSRSPVVHRDGPTSVRRAFRLGEVRSMAESAGMTGATINVHWPERFLLRWARS